MPEIKCVGVCGVGQMGAAGAVACQRAGYRVLLWARDARKLEAAAPKLEALNAWMDRNGMVARGGGSIELEGDLGRIDGEADLVMDGIGEVMEEKVGLFGRLSGALGRGAVFATTTSGLSITEMGRRAGCGERLVGTHFWNPPHLMPLVEVVRGEETLGEVMEGVCGFIASLGKIPVKVNKDVPGFIGNRLLHAMWREAIDLVRRGVATPEDVDLVARMTFGLRMPAVGPMENMDLVGLDLVARIHEYLLKDLASDNGPSELLAKHVREGELGMKSGEGFYDWKKRDAAALVERRDMQIIRQLAFLKEINAC